jgi:hypothetical protein
VANTSEVSDPRIERSFMRSAHLLVVHGLLTAEPGTQIAVGMAPAQLATAAHPRITWSALCARRHARNIFGADPSATVAQPRFSDSAPSSVGRKRSPIITRDSGWAKTSAMLPWWSRVGSISLIPNNGLQTSYAVSSLHHRRATALIWPSRREIWLRWLLLLMLDFLPVVRKVVLVTLGSYMRPRFVFGRSPLNDALARFASPRSNRGASIDLGRDATFAATESGRHRVALRAWCLDEARRWIYELRAGCDMTPRAYTRTAAGIATAAEVSCPAHSWQRMFGMFVRRALPSWRRVGWRLVKWQDDAMGGASRLSYRPGRAVCGGAGWRRLATATSLSRGCRVINGTNNNRWAPERRVHPAHLHLDTLGGCLV